MNQWTAIWGLSALLIIFVAREWAGRLKAWSAGRKAERASQEQLAVALKNATTAMVAVLENAAQAEADNNKLLAGTIKACEAIAVSVGDLREHVAAFTNMLAQPKQGEYPKDALQNPATEEDLRIKYETYTNILNGMNPTEAAERAQADEEKKTMLSATIIDRDDY